MILILTFIIGLGLILGVLVVYRAQFSGELSFEHGRWAEFGDFVGGALNPLLAFFSFVALLATIWIQSRELKNSNETLIQTKIELEQARKIAEEQVQTLRIEAAKEDLRKMIEAVHSEIKELFSKSVDFCPQHNTMGWFFSNSAPIISAASIPYNGAAFSQGDRILLADLCEYIGEMSNYLHEYITRFGESSVSYYYQRRYLTAKVRLVAKGFLMEEALHGFKNPGYGWSSSGTT